MKKTAIYTAMCLSMTSSAVIATFNEGEQKTPDRVKVQMSQLESQGRFDGMTPGTEGAVRRVVKSDLVRKLNFEKHNTELKETKAASALVFQTLQNDLQELSISKQKDVTELEKLRDENTRLQTAQNQIREDLESEQAALKKASDELTILKQSSTATADQVAQLQKSVDSRTRYITYLEKSNLEVAGDLEKARKALQESERKHHEELTAVSVQVAKISGSKQVSVPSASAQSSAFLSATNILGDD